MRAPVRHFGEGKTFPGPTTPFGLVQLSPDTITGGDNAPGYSYEHTTIEGFSFTHMSGVGWYGDFGNLLTMATTGCLQFAAVRPQYPDEGWRSQFRHSTEVAHAGYYAVTLARYKIRAELSAAPHAGILRFTFPQSTESASPKGAILALTREWAAELKDCGVRVNAIVPGEVMTLLYRQWLDTFTEPKRLAKIPLEKRMTAPEEITAMVVFLLSALAVHIAAQHIFADGGYLHLDRALT